MSQLWYHGNYQQEVNITTFLLLPPSGYSIRGTENWVTMPKHNALYVLHVCYDGFFFQYVIFSGIWVANKSHITLYITDTHVCSLSRKYILIIIF